jgi:hypothetical protein
MRLKHVKPPVCHLTNFAEVNERPIKGLGQLADPGSCTISVV